MTPAGIRFLAADISTRQQLLNTTLRGLFAFDQIVQMLKRSPSREVDETAVLDKLVQEFPHERPQRILRTVISWARYAELFRYNGVRKVFYGLKEQPPVKA